MGSEMCIRDRYLYLCSKMDNKIFDELLRIKKEVAGISGSKSNTFAMSYGCGAIGSSLGFTKIAVAANQRHSFKDNGKLEIPPNMSELSNGQLYFYLENARSFEGTERNDIFAHQIIDILKNRFRYLPYHVKLEALSSIMWLGDMSEQRIEELTNILQETLEAENHIFITTEIIEQLKRLGAFEGDSNEHRLVVRNQINEVLHGTNLNDDDKSELALAVYVGMFDHPYSGAFCEEIYALDNHDQHDLYRWAMQAKGLAHGLSSRYVIRDVAEFDNPDDAPLMASFATLPDPENISPQDAMATFSLSCRFLAKHRVSLPIITPKNDAEICLRSIRDLIYAIESGDEDLNRIWAPILNTRPELAVGCVAQIDEALNDPFGRPENSIFDRISLIDLCPAECLSLSRSFIDNKIRACLLYTSPSPRDLSTSRMPSSA